jgi:hypothetical protein
VHGDPRFEPASQKKENDWQAMTSGFSAEIYSGGVKVIVRPDVGDTATKKEHRSGRGTVGGNGRRRLASGGAES